MMAEKTAGELRYCLVGSSWSSIAKFFCSRAQPVRGGTSWSALGGNNESDIVFAFQMSAIRLAKVLANSCFFSCQSTVMPLREEKSPQRSK